MTEPQKERLSNISPRAWEHPADRAALSALRQLPLLDNLVRAFIGLTTEKSLRLISLASAVRASDRQFPVVYKLVWEACTILDWPDRPEVYVSQSPLMNAGVIGVHNPFITINSSLAEQLSEPELLGVIAHELAHIMSGHVLYKTLLWLLLNVSQLALQIPISGLALQAVITALREWDRKSELSADRAGMLVLQDKGPAFTLLMKIAGGIRGEMNLEEFFLQAREYEEAGTILDSAHKMLNLIGQSHPFAVLRLTELNSWIESGAYQKIIDGEYRKRTEAEDFQKDLNDASKSYRESIETSKDPLAQTLNQIGRALEEAGQAAGKQAEDFFKSIFGGKS